MMKTEVSPCALNFEVSDAQDESPLLTQPSGSQIQDASAIPFVRTQTPDQRIDPSLLPTASPAVHAPQFVDFEALEIAAMRGDMLLPPSCPVDAVLCDFVDSLFSADTPPPLRTNHLVLKSYNALKLTVHPTPGDGSCCPSSIFAAWWYLRRMDSEFMKDFNMPDTVLALRQSTVDYLKKHCDKACHALGDQTFRDGIAADYFDDGRELRDSDYVKEAMEAHRDPKQVLHTFPAYVAAMRKPHAYGDEFFIAAAAMLLEAQICVIRVSRIVAAPSSDGSIGEVSETWMPTFYQHPVSKFRLILLSRDDHFEWCHPDVSFPLKECIEVSWNPPPLVILSAPEELPEYSEDEEDELDDCFVSVRQTEDEWFAFIQKTWNVLPFGTKKNSFFDALVFSLNYERPEFVAGKNMEPDWNEQTVRSAIAKCLEDKKGFYVDQPVSQPFDSSGFITMQSCNFIPGCERSACRLSLKEYCAGIASDWTPGDLEIRAAAEHFRLRLTLYEHELEPLKFCDYAVRSSLRPTRMIRRTINGDDEKEVRFRFYLVTDRKSATPFFYQHAKLMEMPPLWNIDLEVVHISDEVGRGIITKRRFKKHDTAGTYDGHRCDLTGKLVIPRHAVSALFTLHPSLNRHVPNGANFQESHSVLLKRSHDSGLLIDGYPLCDPILDSDVNSLGRFALANSASSDRTANIKLIWVPAPNLPKDPVNRASDCECIVVFTRDVEAGVELLWNYPIQHHITYKKIGGSYDSKKAIASIAKRNGAADLAAAKKAVKTTAEKSTNAQAAADAAILQAAAATMAAARAAEALAAAVPATAPKKAAAAKKKAAAATVAAAGASQTVAATGC
jgi:hypothetical protein